MKKAKKILLMLISAVMIMGGNGCGMNSNYIAKEQELDDEWLKEFLAEQELPTEYSKLSDGQKSSVKRIYEMIMYLEDKYGVTFEYTGYVRPQILENEHLTAIPEGGNEKTDTVTVTCEDDGTFTDDYPNVAVRPYYEQMITDYVEDYFDSDLFRVYATITSSTMQSIIDNSENPKVSNIGTSTVVFVEYGICTEDEITNFANVFSKWHEENKLYGVVQLILLKEETKLISLNRGNYSDLLGKQEYTTRLRCNIQEERKNQILGEK